MKYIGIICLVCLSLLQSCSSKGSGDLIASGDEIEQYLQIPSPHWEDQIIYFIITDLFMDGDSSNNDQGEGEYIPGSAIAFNGGDLKGITQKIGYIKELGATGIWITPPVANQWWSPDKTYSGRHGYWATNFKEVDRHFGTLEDYRQLSASLHKNSMYLIQDVVVNHTGNFFTYTGPYDPADVSKNFIRYEVPQPTQIPFYYNDANNPEDREMAIYHFTPNITDYDDNITKRLYQFSDLDDINTSNPLVREVLRTSYNHWIGQAGVDGFRYDTPVYVEHDFWNDFSHSKDSAAPGVETFASMLGKKHFLAFGETGILTLPYDDAGTLEVASYLGSEEKPGMNSVINYPLFYSIQRVFVEMQPTSLLSYRLESIYRIFSHPEWLINLIDDHNGERFLTRGSHSSFRQALLFIMNIPGIPVIYYGTEQDFGDAYRQAMFKGGLGSPDQDHFNTDSESFRFLQKLINIRKEHAVLRRGTPEILQDAINGPGVFAYSLDDNDEYAIILFNTSEGKKLAAGIHTGLEPGTVLNTFYSLSGEKIRVVADQNGNISTFLQGKEGMILFPDDQVLSGKTDDGFIRITRPGKIHISEDHIEIRGTSEAVTDIFITVNGDCENEIQAAIGTDGSWSADLPLGHLLNGKHRILAYSIPEADRRPVVSGQVEFELDLSARLVATVEDPYGDDKGPTGDYLYPGSATFGKQMDIESVRVYLQGSNLKIELQMAEITRYWTPPNGFDHVLIIMYLDLPDRTGVTALPFQNARFPLEGDWDYMVSTSGFENAFFSSVGASEYRAGRMAGPAPSITVDPDTKTISYMISAESIGFPAVYSGTRIYITTWGGTPGTLRSLNKEAHDWSFGGGSESDPKIMDNTELIIIK